MENMCSTTDDIMTVCASLAHPPGLIRPNRFQKVVAQELIELINFDKALESNGARTYKTAVNIPNQLRQGHSKFYTSRFRLDIQGRDRDGYERYAIQWGTYTFAQIHVQIGDNHGRHEIQRVFMESLKQTEDVWLPEKQLS